MESLITRTTLPELVGRLARDPCTTKHIVRPPQEAKYGVFPEDLHPPLAEALKRVGIEQPYSHQAAAIAAVRAGGHVVLTTPTASGKTLCYNVPILERIAQEPESRALYLFPTKALSQDQYTGLHKLIEALGANVGTFTFDGDTPADARRKVRDHGHIIITNPDMLHSGILPQHTSWLKLFENLRYIVIDELHTYRGIFGSHVANLLRRLLRIASFYGSEPQVIVCSATIANPLELATRLTGLDFELVAESGAPRGEHHLICYNPPVVNRQLGLRAGVLRTATRIASDLIAGGVSTIVFAGSRLHVEIMLKYVREALVRADMSPSLVQGYRGGYLPQRRRRIEAALRAGEVKGVIATNALELGIDIGSLQACVLAGYPGSIASLWQQSGRAGRRAEASLTVFVARSSAIDQYMVTHPDVLVGASPEQARINPQNLFVLVDHMKCAAFELPFEPEERFADLELHETREVLEYLQTHGVVNQSAGRFHWMQRVYPATHVNLRGIPEENFIVINVKTERVLAEVDFRSAHTTLYKHAIYNLDADQYQVEELDYENHKAYVRRVEPDYYTTAMTYTRVGVLDEERSGRAGVATQGYGEVLVTTKFVGFKKIRFRTGENIGYGDIHLPDLEMHTTACWFTLPAEALASLGCDLATAIDGLVAVSHALKVSATVTLMCASTDIGRSVGDRSAETSLELGASSYRRPSKGPRGGRKFRLDDFEPTVFLYDDMPGGVGLAGAIDKRMTEIVARALDLVTRCDCQGLGCPSCVGAMPTYDGAIRRASIGVLQLLGAEPKDRGIPAGRPDLDAPPVLVGGPTMDAPPVSPLPSPMTSAVAQ